MTIRPIHIGARHRRGVLLLIVLSLLVIFMLIALAFVLTSSQHKRAAEAAAGVAQVADPPRKLLDSAMLDLLRDTTNPRSVIHGHSLLRDMYGDQGFRGVVAPNLTSTGPMLDVPQFLPPPVSAPGALLHFGVIDTTGAGTPPDLPQDFGYFNGRVLTFLNGPAAGVSTRVVYYEPLNPTEARIRVLSPEIDYTTPPGVSAAMFDGNAFLINGQPFSGTGAGYDPTTGYLSLFDTTSPFEPESALLPNASRFVAENATDPNPIRTFYGIGGLNESYDLADYQNMFLAYMPGTPSEATSLAGMTIPSFYRPALLNYWVRRLQADIGDPPPGPTSPPQWYNRSNLAILRLRQLVETRPLEILHPNFPRLEFNDRPLSPAEVNLDGDAANLRDRALYGPWDVDNDGDGQADSVWIDLGYPVQRAPDGRLYKPMFAILCTDLDGKFNLNAHGNLEHLARALPATDLELWGGYRSPPGEYFVPAETPGARYLDRTMAGGISTATQPTPGQAYGPPEIDLMWLFTPPSTSGPQFEIAAAQYARLMLGGYRQPPGMGNPAGTPVPFLPGRYGVDQAYNGGQVVSLATYPRPGRLIPGANLTTSTDFFAAIQFGHYPVNYFNPWINATQKNVSAFTSPPDLHGRYAFGLDYRGQPVYQHLDLRGPADLRVDSPYELDLSLDAPRGLQDAGNNPPGSSSSLLPVADMPYSPAELERLLRAHDTDAGTLPSRLWDLVDDAVDNGNNRPGSDGQSDFQHPFNPVNTSPSEPNELGAALRNRRLVTTDSYDLPVPSLAMYRDLLNDPNAAPAMRPTGTIPHISQLVRARVIQALAEAGTITVPAPPAPPTLNMADESTIQGITLQLSRNLLPPELLLGERMNVNRPFGNGQDDSGNGVVDEAPDPTGATMGDTPDPLFVNTPNGTAGPIPFSYTNGQTAAALNNGLVARQQFATHLYLLAHLVKDLRAVVDRDANNANEAEETARELAQWAINVVDFRDADSIMTPFEYDINPFNGWGVDGNIDPSVPDVNNAERGVVWGCERPELLITETLAFHDRRSEDLSADGGQVSDGMDNNANFDQRLRPRGTLFVELYNPWTAEGERAAEFYTDTSAAPPPNWDLGVRLNQVSPGGSPVWRLAITRFPDVSPVAPPNSDPDDPSFNASDIERSVYFTDLTAVSGDFGTEGATHFAAGYPVSPLAPGNYTVIGPPGIGRPGSSGEFISPLGRRQGENEAAEDSAGLEYANTRRILLNPNITPGLQVLTNGAPPPYWDAKPSTAIVVNRAMEGAGPVPRNLNITEPAAGYPDIDNIGMPYDPAGAFQEGEYNDPYPIPFDNSPVNPNPVLGQLGTHYNYHTVHLQRLANPLAEYDPILNPYRSVDSMSIDLTVFNGVDDDEDTILGNAPNPLRVATKQRGDSTGMALRNLWNHAPPTVPPGAAQAPATTGHVFDYIFTNSLGYLNQAYGPAYYAGNPPPLNATGDPPASQYFGDPDSSPPNPPPFPWLTWNNRPFVSQMELLMVPRFSSSQLLRTYPQTLPNTAAFNNPYQVPPGQIDATQFPHLANFLNSTELANSGSPQVALNLYRLLDLTHVPSRFVGTTHMIDPVTAAGLDPMVYGFQFLQPPHNHVSNFRDPGRVNLNTMTQDPRLWRALMGLSPLQPSARGLLPDWGDVVLSRRGYEGPIPTPAVTVIDPGAPDRLPAPTFFANPFRSPGAGDMVPLTGQQDRSAGGTPIFDPDLRRSDVEATLLRSNSAELPAPGSLHEPSDDPLLIANQTAYHEGTDRNPYFRYQPMMRLGNTTTARSNVFAVWITVGYFDVTPVNLNDPNLLPPALRGQARQGILTQPELDLLYPDGYMLGRELGTDTGEVERHRSFYMIDRTIPVAFEPGVDHNVEQAILIKRFIE
ncbi:MAG: hypothetical protein WDZ59_03660 [Pirellulales bacterium]